MSDPAPNKQQKQQWNISGMMNIIIVILAVMLVLLIAISVISVYFIRRQETNYIGSAVDYYVEDLNKVQDEINHHLSELAITNTDARMLTYEQDAFVLLSARQRLLGKLENMQTMYGSAYKFFIRYPENDLILVSSCGNTPLREHREIYTNMIENVENADILSGRQWSIVEIDGKSYARAFVYYSGVYVCAYIPLQELAQMTDVLALGARNSVTFTVDGAHAAKNGARKNAVVIDRDLAFADFGIEVSIEKEESLLHTLTIQVMIILLFILVAVSAAYIIYVARQQVIKPMRDFQDNLARIRSEGGDIYFESSRVRELEEANQLIQTVFGQVKELKIEMYEQALEKQKIQLDYLQLQIKPHFYINCLSLIYNMACMGEYEGIEKLSVCISDYFRYIFQKHADFVELPMELEHIKNYLSICKFRYSSKMQYSIAVHGLISDILIPPVLIHTFVENAMKYAVSLDKTVHIGLTVNRIEDGGREFAEIRIEDSGQGFPPALLDCLQKGAYVGTKGSGIGIANALQRLHLLYGQGAYVRFFNVEQGGALVKLCIPAKGAAQPHSMEQIDGEDA